MNVVMVTPVTTPCWLTHSCRCCHETPAFVCNIFVICFQSKHIANRICFLKVVHSSPNAGAGNSETEKDTNVLARVNSENPWGPKRSVNSFSSSKGDSSPRLRGAYADMQIKVSPWSIPDYALRIQTTLRYMQTTPSSQLEVACMVGL